MTEQLAFYLISTILIATGIAVVLCRNAVISAIFLIVNLLTIAGIYALVGAHFVAAIQVLVYAGAIMVLFLFVIMLLNLDPKELEGPKLPASELFVLILMLFAFGVTSGLILKGGGKYLPIQATVETATDSNTYVVGMELFSKYLWPFELASLLILLAIIASIVIAKKDTPKKGKT
ncbi:MAG: NADH-quinone oxidoreductase subunit J [Oligoflexales bacterium]